MKLPKSPPSVLQQLNEIPKQPKGFFNGASEQALKLVCDSYKSIPTADIPLVAEGLASRGITKSVISHKLLPKVWANRAKHGLFAVLGSGVATYVFLTDNADLKLKLGTPLVGALACEIYFGGRYLDKTKHSALELIKHFKA